VTDRVRRAHEQVFHLVKQPRYYSAVDEIREPYSENKPWGTSARAGLKAGNGTALVRGTLSSQQQTGLQTVAENPLGKLPGSVWPIPSAPWAVPPGLDVDHFAAFPPALVRPLVLGWSPPGVCTACAEGRRPVVQASRTIDGEPVAGLGAWKRGRGETAGIGNYRFGTDRQLTGYACACTPFELVHDNPPAAPR